MFEWTQEKDDYYAFNPKFDKDEWEEEKQRSDSEYFAVDDDDTVKLLCELYGYGWADDDDENQSYLIPSTQLEPKTNKKSEKSKHKLLNHEQAVKDGAFFFDGFWFRSHYEKDLYLCLLNSNITSVSVNHYVRANGKNYEVDFLVEYKGNKGVIEINGKTHKGRSDYDHKKRREIMDIDKLNLKCFEFYSNNNSPNYIVKDFLRRLNK